MANNFEAGADSQPVAETTIRIPSLGEIRLLGFSAMSLAEIAPRLFEVPPEAPEAA